MVKKYVLKKKVPLFYWSSARFEGKLKENYGDLLSCYIVKKITDLPIEWVHPKKRAWYVLRKKNYLAIGSIIHHATRDSIIWGSGIIDRKQQVAPADFRAVRGPGTREYLLALGYDCPEVYGDPALLLPLYYNPPVKKKYRIGIIPHYLDYKKVVQAYQHDPEIRVIDMMTMDVEEVTRQILECERTVSSSLHGIIVSHAYGIPSVWVEFSDKLFGDGVKFADYLASVQLPLYEPEFMHNTFTTEEFIKLIEGFPATPKAENLKLLQESLLKSCPF